MSFSSSRISRLYDYPLLSNIVARPDLVSALWIKLFTCKNMQRTALEVDFRIKYKSDLKR